MKIIAMTLTLCFVLFSMPVFSQEGANNIPPATYVDYGACPFECCVYREWTVEEDTIIRKDMKKNSRVAFKAMKGEEVTGITGVVITTKPGVARLIKPVEVDGKLIGKGETVYLLTYMGEGFYKAWHKGKVIDSGLSDLEDMEILRRPEATWWVKIKNKKGQIGWTDQSGNFGNMDACG